MQGATVDEDSDPGSAGVAHLYGHTAPVHALSFSHDNRLLFSGAGDGQVRLWNPDLSAGLAVYKGHKLPVWDVAAGPWGFHFATAGADRTARIWATDNMRILRIPAGGRHMGLLYTWTLQPAGRGSIEGRQVQLRGQHGSMHHADVRCALHTPPAQATRLMWTMCGGTPTATMWPQRQVTAPCACGMWPLAPVCATYWDCPQGPPAWL